LFFVQLLLRHLLFIQLLCCYKFVQWLFCTVTIYAVVTSTIFICTVFICIVLFVQYLFVQLLFGTFVICTVAVFTFVIFTVVMCTAFTCSVVVCSFYFYSCQLYSYYTYICTLCSCLDETDSDYVEFSNFNIKLTDRKMSRICGTKEQQSTKRSVNSDSNFFRVTFRSNEQYDATGFDAFYQFRKVEGKYVLQPFPVCQVFLMIYFL